ncbi:hydrolase 76 protein [Podochytrium sp. JEL0797]|nr:hydrolase 76 protein [Podochytrium sp. JEL0797]
MDIAILVSLVLANGAAAQGPQIDVTSASAVTKAATAAMPFLKQFYTSPQQDGSWDQTIVQWHESAIYWDQFYHYASYSGDSSYNSFVDGQLLLGTVGGDFLDGNSSILGISGRWNDDIGWWALATTTAAEHFGVSAIIDPSQAGNNNPTYFGTANMTYHEMLDQWDTTQCGGGIYWSRNRQSTVVNQLYYKSTISNAEHMDMGARMYALTGDKSYLTWFNTIYAWLKSSGIIAADYTVWDGLDTRGCVLSKDQYSYHSAELISAMAVMYNATQQQSYLTEAHAHFAHVQKFFTNAQGVLYDPQCVAAGACKSPTGFLWALYRALGTLHGVTTDAAVKTGIETVLRASATANFKTCQVNWNCVNVLPAGTQYTLANGTNPRAQIETVALLNALAVVNGVSVEKGVSQSGAGVGASATVTTKSGVGRSRVVGWLGGVVAVAVAGLMVI